MKMEIIFTAILFIIASLFALISLQYRYEARIAPLLVAIIAMFCLSLLLAMNSVALKKIKNKNTATANSCEKANSVNGEIGINMKAVFYFVMWIIGLVLGIYLFGLVIAIPAFVLIYLKVHKESLLLSIGISIAMFLVVWGFFDMLLHVSLFKGILIE